MYTTRTLSSFKTSDAAAARQPPPQGPASGYLLLQDEQPQPPATCCWGAYNWPHTRIRQLPFPQNRILTLSYSEQHDDRSDTYSSAVLFIPVPSLPLSSNRYYVIVARGKDKGKAYTCSKEDDMGACCFCQCINDAEPKEFDHRDIYQQMEIVCYKGRFTAKPVASDGIPPSMLRKEYWDLHQSEHDDFTLVEASGVNEALRSRLPALYSPSMKAKNGDNVVVGRWYIPFVFVKEEMSLSEQVKQSAYYEIALEQFWEQIGACESAYGRERVAEVKSVVRVEVACLNGTEAKCFDTHDVDGLVWFKTINSGGGRESVVKLSYLIWERIKWEESRMGCNGGEDEKVERVEECRGGAGEWKRFGCYVLVERFVLRRMDGSEVLMVDFRHCKKVQSIWE